MSTVLTDAVWDPSKCTNVIYVILMIWHTFTTLNMYVFAKVTVYITIIVIL